MTREELIHILRAASRIAEDENVLVIGSQSILGTYTEDELPDAAVASMEADIAFFDDDDNAKSDAVDFEIGEDSRFHELNGYYAQGVGVTTATLPLGWQLRVQRIEDESALPGRGICLEKHDLVVSKLFAGRPKDFEFADALAGADLIEAGVLHERVDAMDALPLYKKRMHTQIDSLSWPPAP
jgi:hypothetical protein